MTRLAIIVRPTAADDVSAIESWWREHRPDAPDAIAEDLEEAFARLAVDARAIPVLSHVGSTRIRRLHLRRTRRHVYFTVQPDAVIVLAVWGSVRAVLPQLRARLDAAAEDVPPHFASTARMLRSAFLEGVSDADYPILVAVLRDAGMSNRSVADALARSLGTTYDVNLYRVQVNELDARITEPAKGAMRDRLRAHGYEEWLAETDD